MPHKKPSETSPLVAAAEAFDESLRRFALFQILDATLASAIIVALLIAVTYNRLPWRGLPARGSGPSQAAAPPPSTDAYAGSP